MKKGINAWAKELKHNEGFAKQYEGVKTVQDIINVAKKQGYDINERELKGLDLDAVSGGALGSGIKTSIATDINIEKHNVHDIHSEIYATGGSTQVNTGNVNVGSQKD